MDASAPVAASTVRGFWSQSNCDNGRELTSRREQVGATGRGTTRDHPGVRGRMWHGYSSERLGRLVLTPADYDDVIATVAHPYADIETTLRRWIETGPGPRPFVTITAARRSNGDPVPLEAFRCRTQQPLESTAPATRPACRALGLASR